jgi:glutamate 5-kinase
LGDFGRGDPVSIEDQTGAAIGAALVSYSAEEARAIAGRRSDAIEAVLGYAGRAALAHRDDMVVWDDLAHGARPSPTAPG